MWVITTARAADGSAWRAALGRTEPLMRNTCLRSSIPGPQHAVQREGTALVVF
eukprot:CAMPEP_0179369202 /NCGR_PEP_ID=MMETSP0797-20121207/84500_1 /TAXON_ID=47934 /ORGANISM="Dinophysis acuminata, Strain DAEP01" /LENGTH=52 /DNA_ID=CAMNT_0021084839 /DNA_START=44 /DNA_END=199 /DNA_ORIENTATION=-